MKPINLRIVSDRAIEATISLDGSQSEAENYFALVSVEDSVQEIKISGVDPLQSFSLGIQLIEQHTEEKRIGNDDQVPVDGAAWRIEIVDE